MFVDHPAKNSNLNTTIPLPPLFFPLPLAVEKKIFDYNKIERAMQN